MPALHHSLHPTALTQRHSQTDACKTKFTSPRRILTRAGYQQPDPQIDRTRINLPAAPPPRVPPPPPPPPPSDPTSLNINISKRGLFAAMLGGTVLWYSALNAGVPITKIDRQRGVALLKTKKGNVVAASADDEGRIFMFDKAGNIYYDTEDSRLGIYIVDTQGEMYNEFINTETGKIEQVYVGNLADLRSLKVKEIGGVNIADLQKSVKGFKGGRVIGFPKGADAKNPDWSDLLPPNAPAGMNKDRTKVEPPAFLEDLEVELEPKGLFGGGGGGMGDVVETLKSLRDK